jgi:hydroxyacylglutathione hydrolase
VAGSLHIAPHELLARRGEISDGEVWVYCGSGYRAAVAASLLATEPGRDRELVVIDDDWAEAVESGLPIAHDQAPAAVG